MRVNVCEIEYYNLPTYALWAIQFALVFYGLSIIHELLHGFYAIISGGSFTEISVYKWVLFIPILQIGVVDGNTFLVFEGTLITSWLIAILLALFTSYQFLRLFMDSCRALNLSGKLFGVQLGSSIKAIGEGVYALPNFTFPEPSGTAKMGDGTIMYYWFQQMGYSPDIQYFIAFLMIVGAICVLTYVLKCHPIFCSRCGL